MPTRGRTAWAAKALQCFLSQTYEPRELVILDDTDDPSFPEIPEHPLVTYHRLKEVLTIPVKRNHVNSLSRGQVIIHWDSDDWSANDRITQQVELLQQEQKALVGYNSMLFFDVDQGVTWRYHGRSNYALGTSLCYTREFWHTHPFRRDKPIGSDNSLVKAAQTSNQIISVDVNNQMVARIHQGNTSKKRVTGPDWKPWTDPLPDGFPG